jgi:hypothetical protein
MTEPASSRIRSQNARRKISVKHGGQWQRLELEQEI